MVVATGKIRGGLTRPFKLGRYELHHKLGTGGMASVYVARLMGTGGFERLVAVKRIHEHLSDNPTFREMFLEEAKLAAKLNHPNIVHVTDIGLDDNRPFLVMEYVNGETLSQLLRACHRTGKVLPMAMAARIVAWACEGLHHAHELQDSGKSVNLVHRDISPQNVMISYDGVVKLTDFGIAKAVGRASHTRTGHLKGKISYMSPEQALAQPLDRRSDIFSMGIVLYESTLSRRLFRSDSELETLQKITGGEIPQPNTVDPDYPKQLGAIVMKALAVKPAARYQTIREMQSDLERFLVSLGEPVGSVELAELMTTVFAERMAARASLLANASSEEARTVIKVNFVDEDTSSLSLPGDIVSFPTFWSRIRARSKLIALITIVTAIVSGLSTFAGMMISSHFANSDRIVVTSVDPGDVGSTALVEISSDAGGVRADADHGIAKSLEDAGAGPLQRADADAVPDAEIDVPPRVARKVRVPVKRRVDNFRPPPSKLSTQSPRQWGYISVIADPWCEVYAGGTRIGRTPIMRAKLAAGTHALRLLPHGREPAVRRQVTVRPNELTPVSLMQ